MSEDNEIQHSEVQHTDSDTVERDGDGLRVDRGLDTEEAAEAISERLQESAAPESEPATPQPDPSPSEPAPHPSQLDNAIADYNQRYQTVQARKQQFQQGVAGTDWDEIRRSDPGEYARLMQMRRDAQSDIETAERDLENYKANIAQYSQQLQHAQVAAYEQQETAKLLDQLPEWQDPQVREAESREIRNYLRSRGYNDQQIANVSAQDVLLARDAWIRYAGGSPAAPGHTTAVSAGKGWAEKEIEARGLSPHSVEAGAFKIQERLGLI